MADLPHGDHFGWDWDNLNLLDFGADADADVNVSIHVNVDADASASPAPDEHFPWPPLAHAFDDDDDDGGLDAQTQMPARIRKRDPRLTCENYLAGRVPCACPEMDDIDDVEREHHLSTGGIKRSRQAQGQGQGQGQRQRQRQDASSTSSSLWRWRCQVPSCGADIGQLKGYHRRHRVCLACANAPTVLLDGLPQRYCQQCGKFHLLPDFDEGKRSCRRKLERHNNRRRRRKPEYLIQEEGCKTDTDIQNFIEETQNDPSNGQESKSLSSLGTTDKQASSGSGELQEDITSFNKIETVSVHNNKVSMGSMSTKASSIVYEGTVASVNDMGGINAKIQNVQGNCPEVPSRVLIEPQGCYDDAMGRDSTSGLYHTGVLVEECSEKQPFLPNMKSKAGREENIGPSNCSISSSRNEKHFSYVSVCPTRRISFKLYDWNPAEFPRRLRQQILHWLASMPIELESYIRPGCTILTAFIASPRVTWDELLKNTVGQVQDFLNDNKVILSGKGRMQIFLNNMALKSNNGKITLLDKRMCQLLPKLYHVHPIVVEAGESMEIFAYGKNLLHSNSRFLVSFGGNYIHYGSCKTVALDKRFSDFEGEQGMVGNSDLESFKISIPSIDQKSFGPAFIEVENEYGISNFIPVLIGDKKICSEFQKHELNAVRAGACCRTGCKLVAGVSSFNACESMLRWQNISELLLDIAWVIKNPDSGENYIPTNHGHIRRLNCLFGYLLNAQLLSTTERVLFSNKVVEVLRYVYKNSSYLKDADSKLLQNYVRLAWESLQISSNNKNLKDFHWFVEHVINQGLVTPVDNKFAFDSAKHFEGPVKSQGIETELLIQTETAISSIESESNPLLPLLRKEKPNKAYGNLKHYSSGIFSKFYCNGRCTQSTRLNFGSTVRGNHHRVVIMAVSVIAVCAGICVAFQHPQQVREISMSIRRCLFRSP